MHISCTQVPHRSQICATNNAWLEFLNKLEHRELKTSQIFLRHPGERQ